MPKTHVLKASQDRSMTKKHIQGKSKGKFILTCHHCGILGHIRSYCFNLKKVKKNGGERKLKRKGKILENQVNEVS